MAAKTTHRREWLWPVTIVCVALGGLIAFQVRGQMQQVLPLTRQRQQLVTGLYLASQQQIADLNKQVRDLTAKLIQLERTKGNVAKIEQEVLKQQRLYQIALGLVPVKGKGIHLILDESPFARSSPSTEMANAGLIHDFDLTQVINELRVARAEAIMLNDQRVVPSTAVRCVGSVIKVNEAPVVPPYHIYAIGKPDILRGALEMPNGVLDNLRLVKFQVKLTEEDEVRITAVGPAPSITEADFMSESEAKAR